MNLREYIDQLRTSGYTVRGSKGEDPVLIAPDGSAGERWREDYPEDELMDRDEYEEEKYRLQIELLKFQYWTQDVGAKHIVVFEGRDAAGKPFRPFVDRVVPSADGINVRGFLDPVTGHLLATVVLADEAQCSFESRPRRWVAAGVAA